MRGLMISGKQSRRFLDNTTSQGEAHTLVVCLLTRYLLEETVLVYCVDVSMNNALIYSSGV